MNRDSPAVIADAIDGRALGRVLTFDERRLLRAARRCAALTVPGPSPAALQRIDAQFDRFVGDQPGRGPLGWLAGWLGSGLSPRPLAQRLAAGALVIGALGSGTVTAAGISPWDAVREATEIAHSIVVNLNPGRLSGPQAPSFADPDGAPAPTATATPPSPTAQSGGIAPPPSQTPIAEIGGTPPPSESPSAGVLPTGEPAASATPEGDGTPTAAPAFESPEPSPTGTVPPKAEQPDEPQEPNSEYPGQLPSPVPPTSGSPARQPSPSATPTGTATPVPTATPSSTPSPSPSPLPSPTVSGGYQTATYQADVAGTVTLRYSPTVLEFVSANPAPGWSAHLEGAQGNYFEVKFDRPDNEVKFEARLIGGVVQVTVTPDGGGGHSGSGSDE